MNITTGGGPHILLFERDQQLAALLTSEFQLAGYEFHTARTAVEVFDAIARYPVRLVLVNLAQAAAGRREFWVALDAQRRGRGLQVFTFRCLNIAGYGPMDADERGRTGLADMEVDGMLGVMNLVDAVRSRLVATSTGSMSRVSAVPVSPSPSVTQVTAPLPLSPIQNAPTPSASFSQPPVTPQSVSAPAMPAPPSQPVPSQPTPPVQPTRMAAPGNTAASTSERIRAIIYPSSRSFSPMPEANTNWAPHGQQVPVTPFSPGNSGSVSQASPSAPSASAAPPLTSAPPAQQGNSEAMFQNSLRVEQTRGTPGGSAATMQPKPAVPEAESGLAQLSRMLQERYPSLEEEVVFEERPDRQERQVDAATVSTMPLRASPIEDIPIEREPERRLERPDAIAYPSANLVTQQASPAIEQEQEHPGQVNGTADANTNLTQQVSSAVPTSLASLASPASRSVERELEQRLESSDVTGNSSANPVRQPSSMAWASTATPAPIKRTTPPPSQTVTGQEKGTSPPAGQLLQSEEQDETEKDRALVQQVQAVLQRQGPMRGRSENEANAASDNTLLDIVQSLPPMAAPPPQQQVLSGRATRSLGSVLLEGHLVPQDRLEVAQNIQRMLRGVDMNYQLGEILLMFKLLTHDQLLAASLVSYGMITTAQIRALGRIRQELHSIGLEYDLENLLILFRILSPEQLREVRASWSG